MNFEQNEYLTLDNANVEKYQSRRSTITYSLQDLKDSLSKELSHQEVVQGMTRILSADP